MKTVTLTKEQYDCMMHWLSFAAHAYKEKALEIQDLRVAIIENTEVVNGKA